MSSTHACSAKHTALATQIVKTLVLRCCIVITERPSLLRSNPSESYSRRCLAKKCGSRCHPTPMRLPQGLLKHRGFAADDWQLSFNGSSRSARPNVLSGEHGKIGLSPEVCHPGFNMVKRGRLNGSDAHLVGLQAVLPTRCTTRSRRRGSMWHKLKSRAPASSSSGSSTWAQG